MFSQHPLNHPISYFIVRSQSNNQIQRQLSHNFIIMRHLTRPLHILFRTKQHIRYKLGNLEALSNHLPHPFVIGHRIHLLPCNDPLSNSSQVLEEVNTYLFNKNSTCLFLQSVQRLISPLSITSSLIEKPLFPVPYNRRKLVS